jgi:hypothetical protein
MKLVERFFGLVTEKQIRRGLHRSHCRTRALEAAIRQHIDIHDQKPRPLVWTESADRVFESLGRLRSRISDSGH